MLIDIAEPEKFEKKYEPIVGIDFGTTNSLIGIYDATGVKYAKNQEGYELFKSEIEVDSLRIPSVKRLFGRSYSDLIKSENIDDNIKVNLEEREGAVYLRGKTLIELASIIFKKLKSAGENQFGIDISKAVVTVPAYFDDSAKTMIRDSARLAGINVVRLLAEPTAAAYSYGLDLKEEGNYIVYDLGGGTFDVSILKMRMGAFQVVSVAGDNLLGGDDIDFAVAKFISNKFFDSKLDIHSIIKEARLLKENPSKEIEINSKKISITLKELNIISQDLIEKTINLTRKAIFDSKIQKFEGIILVGGSSRLPLVKERIASIFHEIKIIENVDPDKVVVSGASKQGWNIGSGGGDVLIDAIPLSLGIELMGGIIDRIIPRNTAIPATITRKFTTYADNQTGLDIHIVQGDRELASDCRSLARFNITKIPPMLAGKAVLNITFNIDSDGLLTVSAFEEISNQKQEIVVKPSYGLSEEKVFEMLKNSMDNAQIDFEISKKIEKKVNLDAMVARLQKIIRDNSIFSDDVYEIKNTCDLIEKEIDEYDINQLDEKTEYIEKIAAGFIDSYISMEFKEYLSGKKLGEII
jgi:molecular chaperone HscA